MRHWFAAAALLALLAPSGATASSTHFSASNLQWSGNAAIDMDAVAMDLRLPSDPGDAGMRLVAGHAHIETDSQRKIRADPASFSTTSQPAETATEERSDWDAAWQPRESAGLFIEADSAQLRAAAQSGTITLPTTVCLQEPTYFTTGREPACPDLTDTAHLQATATAWALEGNFTLTMWQWESADGLWSGSRPTTASNGIGEYEFQLLHLIVTQGRLEFNGHPNLDLYAAGIHLASTEPIALAVPGQSQTIQTKTAIDVVPDATGLATSITGPADNSPQRSLLHWAGLAVIAPPALLVHRRRKATSHMRYAAHNLLIGNNLAAFRHADRAQRTKRYRDEGALVATIALIRGEELDAAEGYLLKLGGTLAPAASAFLQAQLRLRQGSADEARKLIQECLRLDPTMHRDIDADPALAKLVKGDPGVGYQ
jgi:hypothetical protein